MNSGLHERPLRISLPIKSYECLYSCASMPIKKEIVYVEIWSRENNFGSRLTPDPDTIEESGILEGGSFDVMMESIMS